MNTINIDFSSNNRGGARYHGSESAVGNPNCTITDLPIVPAQHRDFDFVTWADLIDVGQITNFGLIEGDKQVDNNFGELVKLIHRNFKFLYNMILNQSDQNLITITFDVDGGSESIEPIIIQPNTEITLPVYTGTKQNATLANQWKLVETGAIYNFGQQVSVDHSVTFKLVWNAATVQTKVRVSFSTSGGSGTISPSYYEVDPGTIIGSGSYPWPTYNNATKSGYTLATGKWILVGNNEYYGPSTSNPTYTVPNVSNVSFGASWNALQELAIYIGTSETHATEVDRGYSYSSDGYIFENTSTTNKGHAIVIVKNGYNVIFQEYGLSNVLEDPNNKGVLYDKIDRKTGTKGDGGIQCQISQLTSRASTKYSGYTVFETAVSIAPGGKVKIIIQ